MSDNNRISINDLLGMINDIDEQSKADVEKQKEIDSAKKAQQAETEKITDAPEAKGSFILNIQHGRAVRPTTPEERKPKKVSVDDLLRMTEDTDNIVSISSERQKDKDAEELLITRPKPIKKAPPVKPQNAENKTPQTPQTKPKKEKTAIDSVLEILKKSESLKYDPDLSNTEIIEPARKVPDSASVKNFKEVDDEADKIIENIYPDSESLKRRKENEQRKKERKEKEEAKRKKFLMEGTAFIFIALIALFNVLNLIIPDRSFSNTENRGLASFPKFSVASLVDGSYFSGISTYVADQFIMRDSFIKLKYTEDTKLGKKDISGVFLGKDGYLMLNPDDVDYAETDKTIEAINNFSMAHPDLNMNMCVIPNAVTLMPDYLPENAPVHDQKDDMLYLKNRINGNITFNDCSSLLMSHQNDYIFYKTDHHWTSLACYYAFMDIAANLGINAPLTTYNIFPVTTDFKGTTSSKTGNAKVKDRIDIFVPQGTGTEYYVLYNDTFEKSPTLYQSARLEEKDKYTVFLGGNHPLLTINTTNANGKVLLMFKDSFANSFVQFLIPYYEEIIMVDPRYYYDSVEKIIENESVTDVLFLYNTNTIMTDTSLKGVIA